MSRICAACASPAMKSPQASVSLLIAVADSVIAAAPVNHETNMRMKEEKI
jgi:hypothetical protein